MEKTLTLTPKEITIILKALAKQPYEDVAALMRKIVEQTAGSKTNEQTE